MKKLLILGGSRYIIPVIETAHRLGLYVITCDYLPDNEAHKYSDEYCNVSVIDKDAVLSASRRLNIDGIISFACDPGVVSAAYTAEKMGLPFQGPYESVRILQDKGLFRRFLADNGFNAPKSGRYTRSEIETAYRFIPLACDRETSGLRRQQRCYARGLSRKSPLSYRECFSRIVMRSVHH